MNFDQSLNTEWEDLMKESILKNNTQNPDQRQRYYSINEFRKVSFDESLNTVHTYSKDNQKEIKNFESSFKTKKKAEKIDTPKKKLTSHKKRKNSY